MQGKRTVFRDMVAGALVLGALALPFMPMFGDGATQMQVRFRTNEMAKPRAFTTRTSRNVCTVMAAALSYESPDTGEYTRVACDD